MHCIKMIYSNSYISDDAFLSRAHIDQNSYHGKAVLKMFYHYSDNNFCASSIVLEKLLNRESTTLQKYIERMFADNKATN